MRLQFLKNALPKPGLGIKSFSGMHSSISFGRIYLFQPVMIYNSLTANRLLEGLCILINLVGESSGKSELTHFDSSIKINYYFNYY